MDRISSSGWPTYGTNAEPSSAGAPEAGVVGGQKDLADVAVGRLDVGDAGRPQLLRQPALEGLEQPLHPSARLGRIGRDVLDAELRERPADLRRLALVDGAARLRGLEVWLP